MSQQRFGVIKTRNKAPSCPKSRLLSADFDVLHRQPITVAERFHSVRNLHRGIQKQPPDFFVGAFIYGLSRDCAGNTLSNLDVTLRILQAAAPQAKIVVLMQPGEDAHISKLLAYFPVDAVLRLPVSQTRMRTALHGGATDLP